MPPNNGLSIRHSTRNFPNREGSKVTNGQIASVALMDARSIAATAANKGYLTSAADMDVEFTKPKYFFDSKIYENRVYDGVGKADPSVEIKLGPKMCIRDSINTLIMSILYKADPRDVKLIMIDPKVVELSVYNGIPHLFCPVVTDPKEAAAALNWAVREMGDRYNTVSYTHLDVYKRQTYKWLIPRTPCISWGFVVYLLLVCRPLPRLLKCSSAW